jgi:SAM-dependent methyltransferase
MIEEAKKRNTETRIRYRVCAIENYEYPKNTWDCVISNLALHYIESLEEIFQKVRRTLKPNGIFLLNIEHPIFTAGVGQDWIYTESGAPQYWPIDNYFTPGERTTHFLGCPVTKQHHTLTQILMGLLSNGFELNVIEEAKPPREMMTLPARRAYPCAFPALLIYLILPLSLRKLPALLRKFLQKYRQSLLLLRQHIRAA